jgi:hypothetical protein
LRQIQSLGSRAYAARLVDGDEGPHEVQIGGGCTHPLIIDTIY